MPSHQERQASLVPLDRRRAGPLASNDPPGRLREVRRPPTPQGGIPARRPGGEHAREGVLLPRGAYKGLARGSGRGEDADSQRSVCIGSFPSGRKAGQEEGGIAVWVRIT